MKNVVYNIMYISYITYKLEQFCGTTTPLFFVPLFMITMFGDDVMCFHPCVQFQKKSQYWYQLECLKVDINVVHVYALGLTLCMNVNARMKVIYSTCKGKKFGVI